MYIFVKKVISLNIVFLLLLLPIFSTTTFSQTKNQSKIPKIQFEKYTLPNGLEVILHVDRKLPFVHVNQWFHVGSANERVGRSGFAHLFEHMMFQGSKNADRKYFEYVESAGANLSEGGVNGTTNQDRTNYFATVPSGNLENLLWLEADRLATLPEALTKEKLDNQRDVVKNERRQNLENQPYGQWDDIIKENLYPQGHPYQHGIYGSHEDLTAASLDDVKEFFRTYYTPNNLSLVIAGDFDVAEAKRLVEKYFGSIPPGPPLRRPAKSIPKLDGEKIVEVNDRVSQERAYFVWHTPAFFDLGDAEMDITSAILTGGISARLNKALLYDKQLASNVGSFQRSQPLSGNFVIRATARKGVDLSQIEQIITSEIVRLAQTGPTAEELNRAKVKWEFNFIFGLERIGGFGGKADLLNQYNTYLGDPGKFQDDLGRYRNVTIDSVREAVDKYLNTKNRLLVRFHPEKSVNPANEAIDRTKEPPLGGDKPFKVPEIKTVKLENGLEIFVIERPELPRVSVRFATKAGSIADPFSKSGLSHLTVNLIKRGTKTRDTVQIDESLGDLGAWLAIGTGKQYVALYLDVLKHNLNPALEIMSDVALNPAFPADEFERIKKSMLDSITQLDNNPNSVATDVAYKIAFGQEHPYARSSIGSLSTINAITGEDVMQFHRTNWKPASSAIVFVGDITLAEATNLARQHFGKWTGGAAPKANIPAPKPMQTNKIYMVDWQGAAQTIITHILPAPKRTSEDYYPVSLANAVYGGGFGARLNMNLREDKGFSYGVFAYPVNFSEYGVWMASGSVQINKTKESVAEFMKELKFLAGEKPISEKELTTARLAKIRGYAQQFESYDRVAGQILDRWFVGLPMSDLQRETDEFAQLKLKTINSIAAKYAAPAGTSILLVSDLSKIETGIRELNLGGIVILDKDGRIINK